MRHPGAFPARPRPSTPALTLSHALPAPVNPHVRDAAEFAGRAWSALRPAPGRSATAALCRPAPCPSGLGLGSVPRAELRLVVYPVRGPGPALWEKGGA